MDTIRELTRLRRLTDAERQSIKDELSHNLLTITEIARRHNVARITVYRINREGMEPKTNAS